MVRALVVPESLWTELNKSSLIRTYIFIDYNAKFTQMDTKCTSIFVKVNISQFYLDLSNRLAIVDL